MRADCRYAFAIPEPGRAKVAIRGSSKQDLGIAMVAGADFSGGEVTRLLHAAKRGDGGALEKIVECVYDELRRVAGRQLRRQPGHTLQATELVHESYVKLMRGGAEDASDRAHFLAIAARAMRQVLVDRARRKSSLRRGGDAVRTTLTDGIAGRDLGAEELLALDRAMEQLDPRQRQVVECRFFGGMEEAEIAEALNISERTVRRDWVKARAWLYRDLYPQDVAAPPTS
jgi:RNA polymerase sigma factor (TIGR02999 family)